VQSSAELYQQRSAQWETWARAIIRRELAEHDLVTTEATGEVIGIIRRELREEIRIAVAELRTELTTGKHDSKTLDLPALPFRKRSSDAA
jgi:hypothetical protein